MGKRQEAFMADLQELLNKHKAELEVTDNGRPYGMHAGVCEVSLRWTPEATGECFNLPRYMQPENPIKEGCV